MHSGCDEARNMNFALTCRDRVESRGCHAVRLGFSPTEGVSNPTLAMEARWKQVTQDTGRKVQAVNYTSYVTLMVGWGGFVERNETELKTVGCW